MLAPCKTKGTKKTGWLTRKPACADASQATLSRLECFHLCFHDTDQADLKHTKTYRYFKSRFWARQKSRVTDTSCSTKSLKSEVSPIAAVVVGDALLLHVKVHRPWVLICFDGKIQYGVKHQNATWRRACGDLQASTARP